MKPIARSKDIPGGALLVSNQLEAKLGSQNYNSLLSVLEQESVYEVAPKISTKDGDAYLYHTQYPVPVYKDFFDSIANKVDSIGDCYLNTPAYIFDCGLKTKE